MFLCHANGHGLAEFIVGVGREKESFIFAAANSLEVRILSSDKSIQTNAELVEAAFILILYV